MILSPVTSVVAFLLLGLWPKFGEDPLENRFPLEAEGNIHFQADAVLFFEAGEPVIEVLVAIPTEGLGSYGDSDSLHVEVGVAMLDSEGESRARYRTEMKMAFPDSVSSSGGFPIPTQWIRLRPTWQQGTHGLEIRVEDLTQVKRGLLDRVKESHPYGVAAARVPLSGGAHILVDESDDPGVAKDAVLSGIFFVWEQKANAGNLADVGLRRIRSSLRPNPYRYYGLFQPVLTVYWEQYGVPAGTGLRDGDEVTLRTRITANNDGREVYVRTESVSLATEAKWDLKRIDVSTLLSGAYQLELQLRDGDIVLDQVSSSFQVLWEHSRWVVDTQTMIQYARVLLDPRDFAELEVLDRGGREAYLRDFWNRHYPTAAGIANPLETKFLDRVAHANRHYSTYEPGVDSDRGRVFIQFGEPDELTRNLNPQDMELLYFILPGELDGYETDPVASLRQTKARSPQDNRAYEIWDYDVRGDPLIPNYGQAAYVSGLKFVFVDELGFGDYKLAYTSLPGGLR